YENGSDPTTYKFHIFGTKNANNFIQVTANRWTQDYCRSIFTMDWKKAAFGLGKSNVLKALPQPPKSLLQMKQIAEILAHPFDYVRIDLYEADSAEGKRAIAGELTFTPMCGTDKFYPAKYDEILGAAWRAK
ncbi:ATP-grasp fold amidoligase family protein, partial [Helicobacter sp. 23-1045]